MKAGRPIDNGLATADGRLTAEGRRQVDAIQKRWAEPVAILAKWPGLKTAVWRILRGGGGSPCRDMLADLNQEMWVEAVARVAMFDPHKERGASLETFALWGFVKGASQWVRRKAAEYNRLAGREVMSVYQPTDGDGEFLQFVADRRAVSADASDPFGELQAEVDRLPPAERAVVTERFVNGRTYDQTASHLGVSVRQVRETSRLTRRRFTETR